MATEDEAREAADGTEIQVEAVDLGTVHLQAHPEVKLSSIIEIKKVGEIIDSTEGTLKVPEDQVLVEASSEVELPPEHNLNGKDSSLNGHMGKEKILNEQPLENDQEEAELDGTSAHQSNGIHKEKVTDSLSHGESITEDSSLLKHEKDEEPQGDGQKVTVDDDLVQEDTLKTESATEQTDDGQQDQNQEPEKANEDTQPASIANNADAEVVAEAPTAPRTPVEPHLDDPGEVPASIDEKPEPAEPADCVIHLDHNASLREDTSMAEPTEKVVKVEDQQSQQDDVMDADVVQEEMLTCEETDVQEEVPKSEHADEPATDAHEVLNQESTKETDGPVDEKIEDTVHQSNMAAPEETTTREPPVNIQVQNQESLEEIEDAEAVNPEAAIQQRSITFEEAIPEDQHNLGITVDGGTVQEDTLETIEKTEDVPQDQDVGLEKATENTQPASMKNIPDVEVIAEAPSGVQTPVDINLDKSDGNTETDESAKADGVSHPDHKEGFSEDTSIAEPTEEVVKVEDQPNQQADAMDEDVVKKEVPNSEHADEPATDAQELLNQESTEETDGPVNEKIEETEHKSNMAAPEETTPEHDAQPLEEIEDAEVEMQESSATIETIPEDHVATTEPCCEIQNVHMESEENNGPGDAKDEEITNKSNTENPVQDNILQSGATDIQPVHELDKSESKSTGTHEMNEASDQTHAVVFNETGEPQETETDELKNIEATEAQDFTVQGYVTPSKELSAEDDSTADEQHNNDFPQNLEKDSVEVKETISNTEDTVEDNVTAEEPTCDSQETDNAESTEETEGSIAENIAEVSDVVMVDNAVEEQNVLPTEDGAETHMPEPEPEETKNTEPVETETEEPSNQTNAVLFDDSAQGDNTLESEMQQDESATETTETETAPQERDACVSEEPDHRPESETNCDTQEVSITESFEVIDGDKDIITGGISGQNNMVSARESAQENNVPESEPTPDIQPLQELEPEAIKNTRLMEVKEASDEMNNIVFQTPTEEDNPATIELHESARELTNSEAAEAGTPHQSSAVQAEEQVTEEIASEPQVLEPESVKEMKDTETTEPQNSSQDNIIFTSGESVPEEIATEDNSTIEPEADHQKLQYQESADLKETEDDKPQEIASSSTLSTSEQSTSNDNATATEQNIEAENSEPAGTAGTEDVESDTALAEVAAPEENVERDATADMSPVQEPELQETKDAESAGTEDIMTSDDLPAEKMEMETMETEVVPHESHDSINELTEDGNEPVLELEPVEDTQGTNTTEHTGEPHGSSSDEPTPSEENPAVIEPAFDTQQVQNLTSQEIKDSEDAKTDQFSDLSSFPTPEEADQESKVQELGSTEITRDIESMGTEDHQEHGVSTLEDHSEPNVDDEQVHEDKVPEVKENEAMEAKEVVQESNIDIPDDAAEETSELRSDPDSYVQPAQQVELCKDSENSQLVKAQETSGQINAVALEETPTEDSVASEIDPPVDIKQDHEQEPVEEIKGNDENEAEEEFHTSQINAIEKPASEDNIALIDPTYDIKQENELEAAKEINSIEAINDGEQTENATSEDPDVAPHSEAENETAQEGHAAELNEQTLGNETDNAMLVPGIKDEIQTSLELQGYVTPSKELSAEDDSTTDEPHNNDFPQTLKNSVEVKETISTTDATVEDNVTAEEPTCDSQEVENAESTQETKGTIAENIVEVSDVVMLDDAVEEQNVLPTEDAAETHMLEPEPEETKHIEPVETEEPSNQTNAVLFSDSAQGDNTSESEMQQAKSATETTETETAPQESDARVSEEPDHMIESETNCNSQEVSITESFEAIDVDKDIITGGISSQNNMVSAKESAQENNVPESEPTADIQPLQELEPEAIKNTGLMEVKETSDETSTTVFQTPSQEDNPAIIELHESARELTNSEAAEEGTPHQSSDVQSEEQVTEEIASEPQVLEPESVKEMNDTETTEPQNISQDNIISTSGESVLEEIATEDNSTIEPDQESADFKEIEDDKPQEMASLSTLSTSEQSTSNDNATATEQNIEAEKSEPAEGTEGTEDVRSDIALAEVAAPEENVETDATADMSPVQEPELQETKDAEPAGTEDIMTSDLDQQPKEDEKIESQKEEFQTDEQKHEDKGDDFSTEPLVESEGIENDPTYRTEDSNACEAEETEIVRKHEEAPHASEESAPISMKIDNVKRIDEGTEDSSEAKNDNKDVQESTENDDIVAKDSTDEQDETTGENTNEEDPASITQIVESGEHREDKECTDKVNDDVHAIQALEEEIADEIEDNKEMQNEENAIHHDESETKPEDEEASQLPSNEPCNVDAKTDDTTTLGEEIVPDNASINRREIEEIGESKGLDSTSEPLVESSVQNNVEQDLNSHHNHKVDGKKLSMAEQNAVDIEAMQEKADASASDINQTNQCQEEINIDDVLQLKVEENSFGKIDETVSHVKTETSTTDAVIINDNITDEGSGADGGPSDGSLQTFKNTGSDLDVSSVITASKEESVNENMEDHKLALPAQGENTLEQAPCLEKTEREMLSSEKLLPTEPEDNQIPNESNEDESQDENQIPNEKNEDMQDTDVGDAQKEVEQDLPVSHFLMNLILGKKNSDANENSESEAERKQEETTEDDSCMIISKQEESLGSLPTENKVDNNLTFEPENHDVKCAEETQEMVKEESDNVKLDTERSIQTDEEFNKNTRDLEIEACHGNPQDNISGEPLSEEAASVSTKKETRDIEIPKFWLYDRVVDTVCQESTEASTKVENGSLKSNINDLTNTKASGEDTLGEGQIGLLHESLSEDKSADAVSEQTPLLTESGTTDAKDLSCDAGSVQNLACAKEDEPNESSIIEATSIPDPQLVCEEVEKKEDEQHASTATGRVSEEDLEGSSDTIQKSTSSEVKTDEQAPQITEPVSNTEKILAQEEEISEASMEERENSNFSIKGVEKSQTAVEIQADGPNMKIDQDKKDEIADSKTAMEPETDTEQKSPEVTDGDQQLLVKKETLIKEQVVPGTVENQEQTMSIKSNEGQELFDSKVQERDLNIISPREASDAEENFVDVKPEFSTDEEQSPKADPEEITYDDKTKEVEETKNYTDGAAMKTEAPGATQKAQKKLNLLSGVGSKVKHQLAKVKKAIVGKPGKTKPDSPKS